MQNRRRAPKRLNLISVIFFILISVFYLIQEKYQFFKPEAPSEFTKVENVYDGDTVTVVIGGRKEKIRLIGIDAPEMGQQPWGLKSKEYLESVLSAAGWHVKLETDVEERDKYGRVLAYLRLPDGNMVNLLMVKNGYAALYTFPPNVRYADTLRDGQRQARERRAGIWGRGGLEESPGDYRRSHRRQ